MTNILVIENLPEGHENCAESIAPLIPSAHWICVNCSGASISVQRHDGCLPAVRKLSAIRSTVDFYKALLLTLQNSIVYRLRYPIYPLHPDIFKDIREEFPEQEITYVLSTADECGLTGFFLERFSAGFLECLNQEEVSVIMPPGYFNGMALKESGRYWLSLKHRRFYLETHFETLFDSPRSVAVDAIPSCNYQCNKCQYHSPSAPINKRPMAVMSFERFKNIVDICGAYKRVRSIYPTISGEPLVHSEIDKMVRYVKSRGLTIGFSTNAALLTADMGKRLLDTGLDSIAFSVDTCNPDTYKRLQGGDLKMVERNILEFQENAAKQYGSFQPSMVCVISAENEGEIEEYRRTWLQRGFIVIFSAEHDITNHYRPFFLHKRWAPKTRTPCWAPWHGLYLNSDGKVVVCGAMAKTQGLKESIFDYAPENLWRSEGLKTLRSFELSGKTPGYCEEFSCWTGLMNTWVYENNRLTCHTQGSWMEQPVAQRAPKSEGAHGKGATQWVRFKNMIKRIKSYYDARP